MQEEEEEEGRDTVPQDRGPQGQKEEEVEKREALHLQKDLYSHHSPVSRSQLRIHSIEEETKKRKKHRKWQKRH